MWRVKMMEIHETPDVGCYTLYSIWAYEFRHNKLETCTNMQTLFRRYHIQCIIAVKHDSMEDEKYAFQIDSVSFWLMMNDGQGVFLNTVSPLKV